MRLAKVQRMVERIAVLDVFALGVGAFGRARVARCERNNGKHDLRGENEEKRCPVRLDPASSPHRKKVLRSGGFSMKACRITIFLCLVGCLWGLYGCAAIGAAIGTGIGLATGQPEVALVTGPGGAWIGDKFAEGKREKQRADKAEAALEQSRQDAADARATLLANKAISEHNTHLAPGEQPTPLYGPPMPKPNTNPKSWLDISLWKRLFGGGE